jgi:alpha-beta hydrolase superfamily lysophospholipase
MAGINRLFSSPKQASTFFDNMSFGAFNKPFENEGPMSWLSRDKVMVKKYVDDPYCGFVCSLKFFQDLFWGLNYIGKSKNNRNIRFSLPIYIVAGSNDPVGDKGKGPTAVAKMYRGLHLEEVELTLYENARHEILNETNRMDVYKDLKDWINDHID